MEFTVYLAPKGFVKELVYELGDAIEVADRLVFAPGPPRPAAWAQNIWLNPQRIPIESITDAANKLRALQRNWALFSVRNHRRAKLIEEKLPAVSPKPVRIGTSPPTAPLGSWTLLDKNVIVASPSCSSPFPHGEVLFVENKQDPPNRAYLKLWELFTLLGQAPSPGSFCLDLGGSPGGWAWVLASLGCRVLSVDKAPLEPRIEMMPGVEFRQLSAFALDPREVGVVDWLFCDVVCYPDRLWRLVDRWRTFGKVRNFVCTVKFQGATDHETAAKFAAWPGSRLVHLFNNKHELTWVLLDQPVEDDGGREIAGPPAPVLDPALDPALETAAGLASGTAANPTPEREAETVPGTAPDSAPISDSDGGAGGGTGTTAPGDASSDAPGNVSSDDAGEAPGQPGAPASPRAGAKARPFGPGAPVLAGADSPGDADAAKTPLVDGASSADAAKTPLVDGASPAEGPPPADASSGG